MSEILKLIAKRIEYPVRKNREREKEIDIKYIRFLRTRLNKMYISRGEWTSLRLRAACMGGFSLGCGLGWSAPCVEILKSEYGFSVFLTNVIASGLVVGAAFGTITVPFLIDNIGRKWTMLGMVPIFLAGWLLLICAGSMVPLFVIGRILTGACGGMICVAAPMYSAEISEKEIRGIYSLP